jgi:cytochrome c-type biogenesis protein CcmH
MGNSRKLVFRRAAQIGLLCVAIFAFLGAGDENARFNGLGHRMMCVCGCNQILLECNHVGCNYSDHMREELIAAINHGDNDDLVLQAFIQKYGTTVLAAPTSKGFNRVAWTMPYAVLVLGLGVVTMIVRAWGRKAVALREAAGPTDPAMEPFRDQAQRETEL